MTAPVIPIAVGAAHYAELEVAGAAVRGWLPTPDLAESDFLNPKAAAVYAAALRVRGPGGEGRVNYNSIADELQRVGLLNAVDGISGLSDLENNALTQESLGIAAERVRLESARRRAADDLDRIRRIGVDDSGAPTLLRELADRIQTAAASAAQGRYLACDLVARAWGRPLPAATPTGIDALDDALGGGMRAESVYALAARPGAGKTALVLQICVSVAQYKPVVYLSAELSERQVLARVAAPLLGERWTTLYDEGPSALPRITEALRGLRLHIVELAGNPNITAILDAIAAEEGEAPFVVLDYLQNVARRGTQVVDPRQLVSRVSDELTQWARSRRGTVLVVSSVARGFYQAEGKKRSAIDWLGSAKESGDVDFDASGVLALDATPGVNGGTSEVKIHIAKHRFGPAGMTIGMRFDGGRGVFEADAMAALSQTDRDVLRAIDNGAKTGNEVCTQLGQNRNRVFDSLRSLQGRGIVQGPPLKVVGGPK